MAKLLFFSYIILIIKLVIFKYPMTMLADIVRTWDLDALKQGISTANLIPFHTIKMYIRYYDQLNSFENLFGNIMIFIPYGMLLPLCYNRDRIFLKTVGLSLFTIVLIELFELVTRFGEFDIDDIILNMTGVIIGFVVIFWVKKRMKHKKESFR